MKTIALISLAVTAKLICVFVFAYAKCWFSHDAAQIFPLQIEQLHDETGAESLFLMHSGKDGSLSHLGSYKGKRFLTEQNNIKSQFLGYFRNGK